jgi:DNA-binding CsgD family transcriptional regulator/N-acetylneuraminic acid mutarotase
MNTNGFSRREEAVIGLLFEGKSNKMIAAALGISSSTVEYHLTRIYAKLGVSSRSEAVIRLAQLGKTPGFGTGGETSIQVIPREDDSGESPVARFENHANNKSELNPPVQAIPAMPAKTNRLPGKYRLPIIVGIITVMVALAVLFLLVVMSGVKVKVRQGFYLPTTLAGHTLTRLLDGRVLIVGGNRNSDEFLASAEIFDPYVNLILAAHPLHTQRSGHSATLLLDGRVLVVGGYNLTRQWLADAEVYNPATDSWTVIPPNHSHGVSHTATLLGDGRVLVVGGCIGSSLCTNSVEIFDPQVDSWNDAMSLQTDRASHVAQLLADGRVLVAGGDSADRSKLLDGDATIYDPQKDTWSATEPMITPRSQAKSVLLSDGSVLVTGGIMLGDPQNQEILAGTEIYDPISNTWKSAANLTEARYDFVISTLSKGRVVVAGGARDYDSYWEADSFVQDIELYDPRKDRWQVVGQLEHPTAAAAAALLSDGRLWVTGGQSGHTKFRSDTWLIQLVELFPG